MIFELSAVFVIIELVIVVFPFIVGHIRQT